MPNKVAVVTGASCGLGAAVSSLLADKGYTVYGLSRRGTAPPGVIPLAVDVTEEDRLFSAVADIQGREGGIDVAVLAAGCGIAGALEYLPTEEVSRQVSVNLMGLDASLRALTPALRERGGRVLAIGSAAGVFPIPFQAHYSATKAAVEVLLRAYAGEVAPFGIRVGVALLGDTATGFTAARRTCTEGDTLYGGRITGSVARMQKDEEGGASADAVAAVLVRRLTSRRMPYRFTVGLRYRLLLFLNRLLPTRWVDGIIRAMYR